MNRSARMGVAHLTPALLVAGIVLSLGLWAQTATAQPAAPPQRIAAPPAAPSTAAGGARVQITARDYAFDAPESVSTGIVTFAMQNVGQEPHHAQFVRLNEGVSLQQLGMAIQGSPAEAFALLSFEGGPGTIDPGGSDEVVLNLTAGQYAMLCFIESGDGVPHVAKGMFRPFQVAPPPSTAQAPPASGEVVLRDFSFSVPPLQAGSQTLRVVNQGPQPHEIAMIKADASLPEVLAALMNFDQEPPFSTESAGGLQAIGAGKTAWVNVNLSRGTYVLLCFVPDPATGSPHVELGMVATFVIP